MATIDNTPTFNLKAVIQETGLKPDTLRAWERRYGLPQPQRTSGGHRLYSQRDIDMLRWLVVRQEEGLSISRAVALWRQLEAEDQDPLRDLAYALPDTSAALSFIPEGNTTAELRQGWLQACRDFDEARAEQIISYALALFPAESVCFDILQKGLSEIGEGWYAGDVTVQQEHFVSALCVRRLEALISASPRPTRSGRILIGCAPEDTHTFVPLLLTFLMKQRGWEVLYLGARVPADRLQFTIDTVQPHLVIQTAQQLTTAASLLEVALLLERARVPLAFGGRIFTALPELRQRIPGHYLGDQIRKAPALIEQLLTHSPPLPAAEPASEAYVRAWEDFRTRRGLLEAELWGQMTTVDIPAGHLAIANHALALNLAAALTLGDVNYLCTDIEWVKGLLENHKVPSELLHQYINAYYQAALKHLDDGNPILDWLAELSGNKLSA